MSMRAYTSCRNAITLTSSISPCATIIRPCLSRCAAHPRGQRYASSDQTKNDSDRQHDSRNHHPQPSRRRRLPAFAPFLLALPLGWYLSTTTLITGQRNDDDDLLLPASPTRFIPYTLISRDPVSPTSSIFRLIPTPPSSSPSSILSRLPFFFPPRTPALDLDDPALARALTSVELKQPQLQIARAYTVLPHADGQPFHELRLLIRRERGGEVSGYLHALPLGSQVEIRGPRAEYVLPDNVQKAVFLAGGTGIAPALQVGDLLADAGGGDLHVLWASRGRGDCVGGVSDHAEGRGWWRFWEGKKKDEVREGEGKGEMVRRLEQLKDEMGSADERRGRVRVEYFVDEEGSLIRMADVQRALRRASGEEDHRAAKKILFVSGPEGFVNHWAGPKRWVDGRETQGPLGGVLARLDLRGWEVVKL